MEPLYVLRQSKGWEKSYKPDKKDDILRIIRLWDATFSMAYVDFRKELSEIREDNYRHLGFAHRRNVHNIREEIKSKDWLVFPTDDDDWFHHDIIEIVKGRIGDLMCCNWSYGVLHRNSPTINTKLLFGTNSYALKTPVEWKPVENHLSAQNQFWGSDYIHIGQVLSVYNQNLSSLSILKKIDTQEQLIAEFEMINRSPQRGVLPSCFDGHIDQMLDLYKRLLVRKKLKMI